MTEQSPAKDQDPHETVPHQVPAGLDSTTADFTRDTRVSQPRNQKRIFGSILEGKGAEDNTDREPVSGTLLSLGTNYP